MKKGRLIVDLFKEVDRLKAKSHAPNRIPGRDTNFFRK